MERPIFVVGANRSGTTLLRLLLNAHTRIAIPEEVQYFHSYIAGVPIEKWKEPQLSRTQYTSFLDQFLSESNVVMPELDKDEVLRTLLDSGDTSLKAPYQVVLGQWAQYHGKVRWGEKTPANLFYADVIMEMFPEAQFIHMVRDPRAGVASMKRASFFPDDVVLNALGRRKYMTAGRAILEKHVPPESRILLQYEDLVTRPDEVIKKLCTFLKEEYEPGMLQFHQSARQFMKEEAVSSFNAAATRPVSSEGIEKWKSQLSSYEVALIERICEEEMKEFNYESTRSSLSWKGRVRVAWAEMYWQIQSFRNRHIRHYTVKNRPFGRVRTRIERKIDFVLRQSSA